MAQMTFKEKSVWVTTAIMIGTYLTYLIILWARSSATNVPLAELAYIRPMLWMIGIMIIGSIVSMIAVAIANPAEADKEDERDKHIEWYGERIGGSMLSFLLVGPLVLTMTEAAHFWIANAMYTAGTISGIIGAIAKVRAYRRGI